MGVDDSDIQSILRHANIATTQGYYIFQIEKKRSLACGS
jgi:site-specific recombinase XerD